METIEDADDLLRHLAPGWVDDHGRVTSAAYKLNGKPDQNVSVDRAELTTPEQSLEPRRHRGFGIGQIRAAVPRSMGLDVVPDPLPDNEAHALIKGNQSRQNCRDLAENTRVLTPPVLLA